MKKHCLLTAILGVALFVGCYNNQPAGPDGGQNHAPYKPSSPTPPDSATNQNTSLLLSWTGGDQDAGDIVRYTIYFGTANPPTGIVANVQTETAFALTALASNTTYYWYVASTDGKSVTQGDVWRFTTKNAVNTTPCALLMRHIPGGTFQMGQPMRINVFSIDSDGVTVKAYDTIGKPSTSQDSNFEQPHSVTVSSFCMDSTEVTLQDYQSLMGVNPSIVCSFVNPLLPAVGVNWFNAVIYCNARSKRDGLDTIYSYDSLIYVKTVTNDSIVFNITNLVINYSRNGYRLPTEAEWEYACRAGTVTDYYWGENYYPKTREDSLKVGDYAVWSRNSTSWAEPVATKKPNAFGLYDMSGNVSEWCNDWLAPYDSSPQTDPTGPTSGSYYRVFRGGASNSDAFELRSAYRSWVLTGPVLGGCDMGFRCVRR